MLLSHFAEDEVSDRLRRVAGFHAGAAAHRQPAMLGGDHKHAHWALRLSLHRVDLLPHLVRVSFSFSRQPLSFSGSPLIIDVDPAASPAAEQCRHGS